MSILANNDYVNAYCILSECKQVRFIGSYNIIFFRSIRDDKEENHC